ncbi:MAG TPA: type II toxin-antitoxin system HicB family antitoxin [Candidatus Paceibacterota bacterium]
MNKKIERKVLEYVAVFEPDPKVGGFTVTIPALPGCISEGNTFEEALANINEAASLYLQTLRDERAEFPQESRGAVISPIYVRV